MEKKMFLKASNLIFERAKTLRNSPTHAETILWSYLRQKPFGYKFRRQHPVSIYVADFYCHRLKLVIEIDGDIHTDLDIQKDDLERQQNLENEGISFMRFTNQQVEKELELVIRKIGQHINNMGKPLYGFGVFGLMIVYCIP